MYDILETNNKTEKFVQKVYRECKIERKAPYLDGEVTWTRVVWIEEDCIPIYCGDVLVDDKTNFKWTVVATYDLYHEKYFLNNPQDFHKISKCVYELR